MNKKLPKLYREENNKLINNNRKVFYSDDNNIIKENVLESDFIMNTPVIIKTKNKELNCKIVGKFRDHILTSTNDIIKLTDIKSIESL